MPTQNPAQALAALRAQLSAISATVDALASSLEAPGDEILGVADCRARGVGRDALLAAAKLGKLELTRGPRKRLQVRKSEFERWLTSEPYAPKPRADAGEVQSLEDWQRSVLRKVGS